MRKFSFVAMVFGAVLATSSMAQAQTAGGYSDVFKPVHFAPGPKFDKAPPAGDPRHKHTFDKDHLPPAPKDTDSDHKKDLYNKMLDKKKQWEDAKKHADDILGGYPEPTGGGPLKTKRPYTYPPAYDEETRWPDARDARNRASDNYDQAIRDYAALCD